MKNILIIGGAGYIGGLTTDILVSKGHRVTIYDNLLYETRYLKNADFIYGDIRESDRIARISADYDVIILMAALVGDPACTVNPDLAEEINFAAVKNLCELISADKHIIFMSTCSVYGAQDGVLNEESPTSPLSVYASTKLAAEKYVINRGGTIFRLGTVFGLGDQHSRIRLDLVVNVLAMRAFLYHEITINGGEQWRPVIAVNDIAMYIADAVENQHAGVFIISYKNTTMRDLGKEIAEYVPFTYINYVDIPFQDARNYRVDNSKAMRIFTYKPITSVEDEVRRMVKIFEENRIKDPAALIYNNGVFLRELHQMNLLHE